MRCAEAQGGRWRASTKEGGLVRFEPPAEPGSALSPFCQLRNSVAENRSRPSWERASTSCAPPPPSPRPGEAAAPASLPGLQRSGPSGGIPGGGLNRFEPPPPHGSRRVLHLHFASSNGCMTLRRR